ncbi:MAG: YlbF family regulator [Lachnospiraceae bacterium]|nr:YlbF family regulator [Lachnospiraceae bacterium]
MSNKLEDTSQELVKVIKETDIYLNYVREKEKIAKFPEIKEGIDNFRRRNYEIQNTKDPDVLFELVDVFEREYSEFRSNPLVNDFLEAELALCRMMQGLYISITEAINFDMELTGGRDNEC